MPTETLLEEIRKVILSLLVARPDFTPLPVLDHDYYEAEGKRIPWRKFGFVSLLDFLQSMPQYFQFTNLNGVNCIRGIADKSKHVSSLVARQKKMSKYPSRSLRSSYHPHISRFRPKIPAEKLNDLIQYVKNSSNGVSINSALLFIQNQLPYVTLSVQDLQDQLRELGHQLYLDGDIIRSVTRNAAAPQSNTFRHCQSPSAASEPPVNIPELSNSNIVYTVPEECNDIILDTNEDGFVRLNSAHCSRQSKTDERLMSSLLQYSNYGETVNYYNHHDNHEERYDNVDNAKYMDLNISNNEPDNLASLISHRMQSRLKQLVQKYPDGIFCSELPNLYMKEFKMPLNYNELGFNSVCTFASYLPDIFYLTRLDTNDDFVVYSADKRPKEQDMLENDDQEISKSSVQKTTYKTKPIDTPNLQLDLCDMNDNNTPFPLDLSPDVLDKFAPNDVTTLNNIKHILVTDLQQDKKQYLEVYIAEVFTPSFFCIHLRKNVKYFETFMDNLHNFYEQNQERYAIPKLGLKRGLNCACVYNGLWHRAVIKTVKPDFRVTVMFYDYGTQKTYLSEDVFYLAKQFSDLPAQAIPCGLYNIKPYVGDRWKKSITDRFIDRICETLLAATVVSVDPPNNSMLINLTDTSEEKDVCINDWLVQENLARHGKMVRTNRNFPFVEFYIANGTVKKEDAVTIDDTRKHIDKAKRCSPLVLSRASSNAMSGNFLKNVKALSKVPKKESDNNSEQKNARKFHRLAVLVDLVKARRAKFSANIPKWKEEVELRRNDELLSHEQTKQKFNIHLEKGDSDNETNHNKRDFDTCYRHGDMISFDGSVIEPINSSKVSSLHVNNVNSNKTSMSVNKKEKLTSTSRTQHYDKTHDRVKELTNSCVLDVASKEKEYFLPVCNIDHNDENASQSVAKLRRRLLIQDDNNTEMVVPWEIYEKLRMHTCATRTSSCDTVPPSSIENMNIIESQSAENNKRCETKIEPEIGNRDNDSESIEFPQNVHHSPPKDTFQSNTESSNNSSNIFRNRYQMLLERLKDADQYSNYGCTSRTCSSSDPEPSSYYSRSNTDETMNSSDDQREALSQKNVMSHFNKPQSFATKSASRKSDNNKSNVETENLVSNNCDKSSCYVIYPKLKGMNLRDHLHASDMLQHVLKTQQDCAPEQLDSDDLSDSEDSNSDLISDQAEVDDASVTSDSTDNNAKMLTAAIAPVLDDCNLDSDSSIWDVHSGL